MGRRAIVSATAHLGEMKPITSNFAKYQGHHPVVVQKEKESLITKKEAAKRLAISVRTLDRLVAQGLVEKVFVGSSVRLREREIAAIVEQGC